MSSENPYAPPKGEINMPGGFDEGPANAPLASRWARLGGMIIDTLIVFVIAIAGGLLFMLFGGDVEEELELTWMEEAIGTVGVIGVWLAINFQLLATNGQTIGKKIVGVRITRTDGTRASVARIFFLRILLINLISAIPMVTAIHLLDALFIFRKSRKCLHDEFADTIVVKALPKTRTF